TARPTPSRHGNATPMPGRAPPISINQKRTSQYFDSDWRGAAGAKYEMTNRTKTLRSGLIILALLVCSLATQAQTKQGVASTFSALPDLVGIRPGMPAQEAYTILTARNPN